MPAPPNNRVALWYNPRDSKTDRILSYVNESRQTDKNKQVPLTPHPLASTDPNYEGLVFLYREPADSSGAFSRDWYGPEKLLDDRYRVSNVGSGYQSSLLYARGSTPPELDPRVEVKSEKISTREYTWEWSIDPSTSEAGPDLIDLHISGSGSFTGDEVYLDIEDVKDIPGVDPGTFQIVRHIDSNSIQVAVPYKASVTPSETITGIAYEACYILDGYQDTESAPGILGDKFHTRSFTYRLALPSYSPQWDETLGLALTQESRAVPATWATKWDADRSSAGTSDEESSVSYQAVSKLVQNRTSRGISGSPDQDGISWAGITKISVPAICRTVEAPWVWALAQSDTGDYVSYNEDWGISQDVWGPGQVGANTTTYRKIAKTADVDTTISSFLAYLNAPGSDPFNPADAVLASQDIFTFEPETYTINTGSWIAHSGDNIWTKAQVRPFSLGPFLLQGGQVQFTIPTGGLPVSGQGTNIDQGLVTLNAAPIPWGTNVLWDVSVQKSRWGYWVIDFLIVRLPAEPA